jgi:hypothetical protein
MGAKFIGIRPQQLIIRMHGPLRPDYALPNSFSSIPQYPISAPSSDT